MLTALCCAERQKELPGGGGGAVVARCGAPRLQGLQGAGWRTRALPASQCLCVCVPRCRRGVARYENGGQYEGEWRGDHRWGWGVHTFPGGDRYEGEWVDDKIHGGWPGRAAGVGGGVGRWGGWVGGWGVSVLSRGRGSGRAGWLGGVWECSSRRLLLCSAWSLPQLGDLVITLT